MDGFWSAYNNRIHLEFVTFFIKLKLFVMIK